MPPLTAEPTISVFSTKSKISANKVRKYESASERGISVYEEIRAPTPHGSSPTPSVRHNSGFFGPPPPKKQRTDLRNSDITLSAAQVVVAVARPGKQRKPARRVDLNVHIVWEDGITMIEPEFPPDSDVESEVSTLTPPPPSDKEGSPFVDPPTPEDLEYGRDFQSYYVIDEEGEAQKKVAKAPAVKPPKATRKPDASRQQPPSHSLQRPQLPSAQSQHPSRAPRCRPPASRPPAPLPPPNFVPQPQVHVMKDIRHNFDPTKPTTVAEMIRMLDILSAAIVRFGGTPPPPQPQPQAQNGASQSGRSNPPANAVNEGSSRSARTSQNDEPMDGFLAMFDEDDDTDDAEPAASNGTGDAAAERPNSLDYHLTATGTPDGDLTYGIHFIMNALTTWATQIINKHYNQQWEHYNQMVHQLHHLSQPKKGRGRPKKDEPEQGYGHMLPPPPPSVVNAQLTHTNEGMAVQAFQDVLDCGVLRVNDIMPPRLITALGTLYVQIDNLINNSPAARGEPAQWQCMSYAAQMKAHNIKIQRWKEQMAKMQKEVAKQTELSHQQTMVQMGVPPHLQHRGSLSQEQAQRHHDINLEMKRSGQQASQQPHLTQYLTTPMDLDPQRSSVVAVPSSSASPVTVGAANVPSSSIQPPNPAVFQNASSRVRDPLSKVTMYHGGNPANVNPEHIKQLTMRSGQGMKFSFDHGNETARQLFGEKAFPSAGDHNSNIPRRGPMPPPSEQQGVVNGFRPGPHVQTPVLGSNAPPLNMAVRPSSADAGKGSASQPITNGTPGAHTSLTIRPSSSNGAMQRGFSANGNAIEVARKNNETPTPNSQSPTTTSITNKRKHSETEKVNGTAVSESPAPAEEKKGRHTLRLGKRKTSSAASVTPPTSVTSPEDAVVVDE